MVTTLIIFFTYQSAYFFKITFIFVPDNTLSKYEKVSMRTISI